MMDLVWIDLRDCFNGADESQHKSRTLGPILFFMNVLNWALRGPGGQVSY